jgi:branched-subunit amino acid ABC-type transport system permease component
MMQVALNGLMLGSYYGAIAVGFTLIFGVMQVVNFAHGELFMLGAFLFWILSLASVHFVIAVIVVAVVIGFIGIGIDQLLLKRVRGNMFAGIIITVGLSSILQVIALKVWGIQEVVVPSPFPQVLHFMGAYFPADRLAVIGITIVLLAGLWFFLQRTRHGRAIRACIQDKEAAALQGVDLHTSALIAMGISSGLAGVAGLLMSPALVIDPWVGIRPLWIAFVIVIVGGLGSIEGTILAALLFGFLDSAVVTLIDPRIMILVDVSVALLVLAIKPKGLLGRTAA